MRKRGGSFVEFCLGLGTALLVIASLVYLVMVPRGSGEKTSALDNDIEYRYELLLQEKEELEKGMEVYEDRAEERKWLTPKASADEEYACGFAAYVSQASDDVHARVLIGFTRSEDASVDRLIVVADGEEQEIPMQDLRRESTPTEEGDVAEALVLPVDANLPLLKRVAASGRVELRFLGEDGADEEFDALLAESQIRNLGKVLRLYEVYKEEWALEELRRSE